MRMNETTGEKQYSASEAAALINHRKANAGALRNWMGRGLIKHDEINSRGQKRLLMPESEANRLQELFSGRVATREALAFLGIDEKTFRVRLKKGTIPVLDTKKLLRTPADDYLFTPEQLRAVRNFLKAEQVMLENTVSTNELAQRLAISFPATSRMGRKGLPHYVMKSDNYRVPSKIADFLDANRNKLGIKGYRGRDNVAALVRQARKLHEESREKRLLDAAQRVLHGGLAFEWSSARQYDASKLMKEPKARKTQEVKLGKTVTRNPLILEVINSQRDNTSRIKLVKTLNVVVEAQGSTGAGIDQAETVAQAVSRFYVNDAKKAQKLLSAVERACSKPDAAASIISHLKQAPQATLSAIEKAGASTSPSRLAAMVQAAAHRPLGERKIFFAP